MHLTIRTSLAMKALMFCAVNQDRIVRRSEIADHCGASSNHLAQVIYLLAQHGFITTLRGRAGGLRLARDPNILTVGHVFRTFEEVLPFSECIGNTAGNCPLAGACRLTCVLQEALAAFYARLDRTTLADLVCNNDPLRRKLALA